MNHKGDIVNHTIECEENAVKANLDREIWEARWPNYCRTCEGAGASFESYDPSPAGVSLSPGTMTDVSICPDCAEKGICSRCGKQAWDPEKDDCSPPCPHCGWDGKDCLPAAPECLCDFMTPEEAYPFGEDPDILDDLGMVDRDFT